MRDRTGQWPIMTSIIGLLPSRTSLKHYFPKQFESIVANVSHPELYVQLASVLHIIIKPTLVPLLFIAIH